jgi:hypothetical protein
MKYRIFFITIVVFTFLSIYIINTNVDDDHGVARFQNTSHPPADDHELAGWSRKTSRNLADYIFPDKITALIEPASLCRDQKSVFLLIVVCSSLKNFKARKTIRKTWGNVTEFNYPLFDKLHGNLNGSFLHANSNDWREYVKVKENDTSSSQPLLLSAFRIRVAFIIGVSNSKSRASQAKINKEHDKYGEKMTLFTFTASVLLWYHR